MKRKIKFYLLKKEREKKRMILSEQLIEFQIYIGTDSRPEDEFILF